MILGNIGFWTYLQFSYLPLTLFYIWYREKFTGYAICDLFAVTSYFMGAVLFAWRTEFTEFWFIFLHIPLATYFILTSVTIPKLALGFFIAGVMVPMDVLVTLNIIPAVHFANLLGAGWFVIMATIAFDSHARTRFKSLWTLLRVHGIGGVEHFRIPGVVAGMEKIKKVGHP